MNFDWNNPAFIGLVVAIPSFILGYLGYRRAVKVDKITEQSGIAASQQGSMAQVVLGLDNLINVLQEDNKILRGEIDNLRDKLDKMTEDQLELIKQVDTLRKELNTYTNGK